MNAPYRPIDCGLHDRLEDWAVRRVPCTIAYADEAGPSETHGRIADIYARDGAEFLRLDSGLAICLDRIHSINGRPFHDVT